MTRPRVLVTCYPQSGHLHPLIPTARTLADAGCSVLVATAASGHGVLETAGLDTVDLGPSEEETTTRLGDVMAEVLAVPPSQRRPLLFSFLFGKTYAAAVADDLLELARSWRPDALLAGLESLAGPLVAAQTQLPLVVSGFGVGLADDVCDATARAVAPLWARAGLVPSPRAGIFDGLFIDPCPPSLRPSGASIAPRRQPVRPAQFDGIGDLPSLPERRPLVYVTFGTNPLFSTPRRLHTIAEAIAAVGASAIITGCEPERLGTLPAGVVAHRFVPQSLLLPRCDAVLCHAGASTVFGALAAGVPLLLMPLGADHFENARAAVGRGAALALEGNADARAIEIALVRVLGEQTIRRTAAEVADEIAAMPSPAAAADGILAWLDERPLPPHHDPAR